MNFRMKNIFLVLLPTLVLQACSFSGGPIDGTVLEEGTSKPIAGAIVIARWTGNNWSALVHSQSTCYHIETAISDEQGKYRIPRWSSERSVNAFFVNDRKVSVIAYKAGYEWVLKDPPQQERQYLKHFAGAEEQRFNYLVRTFGSACGATDGSEKHSIPLLRAQYEEAQAIAQTPEEKRMLESLLYGLETTEIGFEEAQKRHLERVKSK